MFILGSRQGYNKFDMFNKELNKILHIQLIDNNVIIIMLLYATLMG